MFSLLHPFGSATAGFSRAAETGVVTAFSTTVFEFSCGTLADTRYRPCASATGARVSADQFGGWAACHQEFCTLHPLSHSGGIYCLAFGTGHYEGVVRLHLIGLFLGLNFIEHHLVLAAFHRLHLIAGAGVGRAAARERQGDRESRTEGEFTYEVVLCFHNCVFLSGG